MVLDVLCAKLNLYWRRAARVRDLPTYSDLLTSELTFFFSSQTHLSMKLCILFLFFPLPPNGHPLQPLHYTTLPSPLKPSYGNLLVIANLWISCLSSLHSSLILCEPLPKIPKPSSSSNTHHADTQLLLIKYWCLNSNMPSPALTDLYSHLNFYKKKYFILR